MMTIYKCLLTTDNWRRNSIIMQKYLIEKFKELRQLFVKKRCFTVKYKSKLNGNFGTIGFYGKSIDDVKYRFETEFNNSIVLDVYENVC